MTTAASAWTIFILALAQLHPAMQDLLTPMEFEYTGGEYQDELFQYRLFVPKPVEAGKRYPLVLWLHGWGERGNENRNQMFHMHHLFLDPDNRSKYPFYVLAPQHPRNGEWFDGHKIPSDGDDLKGNDEMLSVVMAMLDKTIEECPIDVDRVYLLGISSGGSAAWELALRYPERFAAVAPIASGGGAIADIARLRDVPVWTFHCAYDDHTSVDGPRNTAEALRAAGGASYFTALPGNSHDAWTGAIRDHRVVWWMLRQRRGQPVAMSPEEWQWKAWLKWETMEPWSAQDVVFRVFVPLVIAAVAGIAWRQRKQRRRISGEAQASETTDES